MGLPPLLMVMAARLPKYNTISFSFFDEPGFSNRFVFLMDTLKTGKRHLRTEE